MNIKRSTQTAVLTLILACLSLYGAIMGVLNKNLYSKVVLAGTMPQKMIWGSVAQDMVSIPLAIILALLSLSFLKRPGLKKLISSLGLAWYFFYAFGLYVIQGQYTSIYVVYLGIWGLSIYSLIWGCTAFDHEAIKKFKLPAVLRKSIAFYLILILVVLVPGWLIKMSPDIARHIPGDTYGVYILDLTVVFPAFGIVSYQLLRNGSFANILAGIILIKGFTLCLSWAFSQISAPFVGNALEVDMVIISSTLTLIGMGLFIPYILNLRSVTGDITLGQ